MPLRSLTIDLRRCVALLSALPMALALLAGDVVAQDGAPPPAPALEQPAGPPAPELAPGPAKVPPATSGLSESPGPGEADPVPEAQTDDELFEALPSGDELVAAEGRLLPEDLSPIGMFLGADIVVKAVIVGLVFASVLTWTIALAKTLELTGEIRRAGRGRRWLSGAASLEHAFAEFDQLPGSDVVANLVRSTDQEIRLSQQHAGGSLAGLKERVQSRLERIEVAAGRRAARGTGLLATIGSTAPFVGLFGTVWGIMNSFIGISEAQTTNLAVVAPGIAEALLATALGLVAAIPAVVIYNMLARRTATYRTVLGDASAEILRHLSRDGERVIPSRIAAE